MVAEPRSLFGNASGHYGILRDHGELLSAQGNHVYGDGGDSPETLVNAYEAYDIMKKVKAQAEILIPLHEPRFASVSTI
jgi:hypothetical protein